MDDLGGKPLFSETSIFTPGIDFLDLMISGSKEEDAFMVHLCDVPLKHVSFNGMICKFHLY